MSTNFKKLFFGLTFILLLFNISPILAVDTLTANGLAIGEDNIIRGSLAHGSTISQDLQFTTTSGCGYSYCYEAIDPSTTIKYQIGLTADPTNTSPGDTIYAALQAFDTSSTKIAEGSASVSISGVPSLPVSSSSSASSTSSVPVNEDALNDILTLLLKVGLIFAAALVPMVIGDKLAGAISGSISKWSKGARESAMKQSKGGAYIGAKRKLKEDRASARAFQGIANRSEKLQGLANKAAGGVNKLTGKMGVDTNRFDATRLSNRMTAGGYGALARANAIKAHMTEAEGMTKDERNKYLSRYAKLNTDTGEWQLHNKKGFMKDHRAMAMVQAQSDAGLLNDDNSPRLEYLNDMRGSMLAAGNGDMVGSTKDNGGYDYLNLHHLRGDVHAALGQHGSALGSFKTPAKLAKVGSEYADRWMHNYRKIDDNERFRGLNKETGQWEEMTGADVKDKLDDQMRKEITPGAIDAIFQSDESGRKAMKIFKPGSEFMDHLAKVNPQAYERAVSQFNYYQTVGRPGLTVRPEDAQSTPAPHDETLEDFADKTVGGIDRGAEAIRGLEEDVEKEQEATQPWAEERADREAAKRKHWEETKDSDITRPKDMRKKYDKEERDKAA